MTIPLDFAPDPARARALDARMHRELGSSLRHVGDASRGIVAFDEARFDRLTDRLLAGEPVMPSTFARYYELVEALQSDDLTTAARLFEEIAAAKPAPAGMAIVSLADEALGEESARYIRMMNADDSIDIGFQAPTHAVEQAFRERLARGFALLDRALPELAGEIRAIIRQLVICGSDPAKKMQFDGGSHYQLWGALFLNGNYHQDEVAVAEVLAHESAHSLLFGFCTDEPLVDNEDDELFSSPLRPDPRPMDGIYHATFVSARMHWAMSRLAADEALSEDQRDRARAARDGDLQNFDAGHAIVAEHAKLTPLGAGLMAAAADYIAAARAA